MPEIQVYKQGNILWVEDGAWMAFAQQRPSIRRDDSVATRMARLKAEREAELRRQREELEGYLGA